MKAQVFGRESKKRHFRKVLLMFELSSIKYRLPSMWQQPHTGLLSNLTLCHSLSYAL